MLEFPGFVKNAQPALDSFGGEDAVSELLAGTRQALQLRLRPGDPLAHPILGLKQQTQGLLLRLSSKAGALTTCFFHHMQPLRMAPRIPPSSMAVGWGRTLSPGSVPVQVRGGLTAMQGCKQRWLRMSSAVCASAAWRTSSTHPARICHRALRCAHSVSKMPWRYTRSTPSNLHAAPLLMTCQLRADS